MRVRWLIPLVVACSPPAPRPSTPRPAPPLFGDLGSYHRAVMTRSKDAQAYFDQGLVLLYGFNHDEAVRSFTRVTELDPKCAMAYWGIAIAHGPHINNPMLHADHARAAYAAIQKAAQLGGTDIERALIAAQAKRYAADPNAARGPLDKAYADAMREVYKRWPIDLDVATIYAESMMDLRPWDLWTADGKAQPGTEEIVRVLESVLAQNPLHPGANHLLIHALEASPTPERALAAADRLRTLVPGAGHLVHMPAHIYQRVGRYEDAAEANRQAIAADRAYVARSPNQHFYAFYKAHNYQFLWSSALMSGRSAEALEAARSMQRELPVDVMNSMPEMLDPTAQAPLLALLRFGRWDELLAEPPLDPRMRLPVSNILRHYARGIAFIHKGKLDEARREREEVARAAAALDPKAAVGNGTPATAFGTIALSQLDGELAARAGNIDDAIAHFGRAIAAEDTVRYNEPPDWTIPTRHLLGAALLDAKRPAEAAAVYRDDLRRLPENGYALFGLAAALQGPERVDAERRFTAAWSHADVKLRSSRF